MLPPRSSSSDAVIAGLLDIQGFAPKVSAGESKPREIAIGKIVRLRMLVIRYFPSSVYLLCGSPDMMDDEAWEPSRLMTRADDAGTDRMSSNLDIPRSLLLIIYTIQPQFLLLCPH